MPVTRAFSLKDHTTLSGTSNPSARHDSRGPLVEWWDNKTRQWITSPPEGDWPQMVDGGGAYGTGYERTEADLEAFRRWMWLQHCGSFSTIRSP